MAKAGDYYGMHMECGNNSSKCNLSFDFSGGDPLKGLPIFLQSPKLFVEGRS